MKDLNDSRLVWNLVTESWARSINPYVYIILLHESKQSFLPFPSHWVNLHEAEKTIVPPLLSLKTRLQKFNFAHTLFNKAAIISITWYINVDIGYDFLITRNRCFIFVCVQSIFYVFTSLFIHSTRGVVFVKDISHRIFNIFKKTFRYES